MSKNTNERGDKTHGNESMSRCRDKNKQRNYRNEWIVRVYYAMMTMTMTEENSWKSSMFDESLRSQIWNERKEYKQRRSRERFVVDA